MSRLCQPVMLHMPQGSRQVRAVVRLPGSGVKAAQLGQANSICVHA